TTFEPGGSPIGRQIRQILLDQSTHKLAPVSELLFFCAERAEHVSKVIRPSLEQKKIVLCDRFYYSTLAFQGYGRGIDLTTTETCCNIAIQAVVPDLVLLLDIDEKIALERIHKRASSDVDGFESETLAFHKRLREGFLQIAQTSRERFLVLNAEQSTDQIWTQLEPTLDHWLSALHIEEAL
ncbi:MAG: dTMP kinase, partial [Bdellovibrionales bacterium]|nr:dTMP kinase [Bdellovibrionales bacterium]